MNEEDKPVIPQNYDDLLCAQPEDVLEARYQVLARRGVLGDEPDRERENPEQNLEVDGEQPDGTFVAPKL